MTAGGLELLVVVIWVLPLLLVLVSVALLILVGFRERPSDRNVARTARVITRRAARRDIRAESIVARLVQQNRLGAAIIGLIGLLTLVLVANLWMVTRRELTADEWVLFGLPPVAGGLIFSAGFLFLAYAYGVWAPVLLERVRIVLESESSTTNASGAMEPARAR